MIAGLAAGIGLLGLAARLGSPSVVHQRNVSSLIAALREDVANVKHARKRGDCQSAYWRITQGNYTLGQLRSEQLGARGSEQEEIESLSIELAQQSGWVRNNCLR
jgi:hypothetical protein